MPLTVRATEALHVPRDGPKSCERTSEKGWVFFSYVWLQHENVVVAFPLSVPTTSSAGHAMEGCTAAASLGRTATAPARTAAAIRSACIARLALDFQVLVWLVSEEILQGEHDKQKHA
jgi:hypothetical protein